MEKQQCQNNNIITDRSAVEAFNLVSAASCVWSSRSECVSEARDFFINKTNIILNNVGRF